MQQLDYSSCYTFYFESMAFLDLSLIDPLCLTNPFAKDKDKHKVRLEGGKLALNRCGGYLSLSGGCV